MYARLTTMQIHTNKIEEMINIFNKSIVPAAKAQKGYCRLNLYLNQKSGEAVSVAVWENEGDARANEESLYYQEQLVKLRHLFSEPPTREGYDLIIEA